MTIRRATRRTSASIPLALLGDERLSWKARGLAALLLSKPDTWRIDASALARMGPDGRHATLAGLKELEEAGYLARRRGQGPDGKWWTESVLFECPQDATEVGFSDVGSPDVGKPASTPYRERVTNATAPRNGSARRPADPQEATGAAARLRADIDAARLRGDLCTAPGCDGGWVAQQIGDDDVVVDRCDTCDGSGVRLTA